MTINVGIINGGAQIRALSQATEANTDAAVSRITQLVTFTDTTLDRGFQKVVETIRPTSISQISLQGLQRGGIVDQFA